MKRLNPLNLMFAIGLAFLSTGTPAQAQNKECAQVQARKKIYESRISRVKHANEALKKHSRFHLGVDSAEYQEQLAEIDEKLVRSDQIAQEILNKEIASKCSGSVKCPPPPACALPPRCETGSELVLIKKPSTDRNGCIIGCATYECKSKPKDCQAITGFCLFNGGCPPNGKIKTLNYACEGAKEKCEKQGGSFSLHLPQCAPPPEE